MPNEMILDKLKILKFNNILIIIHIYMHFYYY